MAAVARRVAEVDPARDRHLCHMSTIFSTKVSFPTLRQLINDLQVPARRDKMSMPSPDAKSIYQDFIITPALLIEKGLHVDRIHPRAIEQRFQYHFMNQLQRKERSDTV